ncbi:MAG: double zinc ribbon domain-containing protein [Microgenomates group bacterium]|jgi:ComF family protein
MNLQDALHLVYPAQCILCDALVATDFGLCGQCRVGTNFIGGLVCDKCGTPLLGDDDGRAVLCDDCMSTARPWSRGRAAIVYRDGGRSLVLALKHGDRMDLARPAAQWLFAAAQPILRDEMIIAPIPLHWTRLLMRRYNQSALLSAALARLTGLVHCPDLLSRRRATFSQDHRGKEARFANLHGALTITSRHQRLLQGRHVLLVDDVMTSGATFAAGAEACLRAGASEVSVLSLTRVQKEGQSGSAMF